ncbi:tRNA lysidine(34) synthetase TilS [Desertimonas flava]|uniref:tRNA lysidine(34) synthetase TilS n=1 Tax=Desertimonas flava TaxID=2064846 RepID=UPI000E342444|nr:tRNA lysidine(34) synthetase TilS [Desertimonas flava]
MHDRGTATHDLLSRCSFPPAETPVTCAFSGGADSTALVALAAAAGCVVMAVHVDHGLRASSSGEAAAAAAIANRLAVEFRCVTVDIDDGPNLEARARDARRAVLPAGHLTGHTADDRAETLLINLMRGTGGDGLTALGPHPTRPILALRRSETRQLCADLGIVPVTDPSNLDPRFVRNRVRSDVLPLLDDIAGRDVAELLVRTADVVGADLALLDRLVDATGVDPTDARALAAADPALARRVLRRWLTGTGYPPDRAAVDRVYEVAIGAVKACELTGGIRVERSSGRLSIRHRPGLASSDGVDDV